MVTQPQHHHTASICTQFAWLRSPGLGLPKAGFLYLPAHGGPQDGDMKLSCHTIEFQKREKGEDYFGCEKGADSFPLKDPHNWQVVTGGSKLSFINRVRSRVG
jgi:hypothetical protein